MLGCWVQFRNVDTQTEANQAFDRLVQLGAQAAYILVGDGVAFGYRSDVLPCSIRDYDPLAYCVEKGHDVGIETHAWICPGRMPQAEAFRMYYPGLSVSDIPGLTSDLWLNFGNETARILVAEIVAEIAAGYAVDGVHLDYVRYLNRTSDTDVRWSEYASDTDVPATVELCYQELQAYDVALSAAGMTLRFGESHGQMWDRWVRGEYIDAVMPMAYYTPAELTELQTKIFEWSALPQDRIHIGLSARDDGVDKRPGQMIEQIEACQSAGFDNICVFDLYKISSETLQALRDYFEEETMDVIDHLLAAEEMLRTAGLEAEADEVADLIARLRVRDDELDALADVIEDD